MAYEDIINPPADVFFPCAKTDAPPGILHSIGIKNAEGIYKAGSDQGIHTIDLLLHVTGRFVVIRFWPRDVDRLMSDIQIAHKNDRLGFLKFFQVIEEG